jgi:hypothetical protein
MIAVDPQDVADLTTLATVYAFLVAADDLIRLTHHRAIRADLDKLVKRVDQQVSALGEQMGMAEHNDGSTDGS